MLTLHGKGVSGGVAIGRARLMHRDPINITSETVQNPNEEWQRYQLALKQTVNQLERLYEWTREELGQTNAQIFSVHAMIAQDEDFNESVRHSILSCHSNAEYAVSEAAEQHATAFSQMDDAYMKERATDVKDIADRILRNLASEKTGERAEDTKQASEHKGGVNASSLGDIICADDLTPGETIRLDRATVSAFVTAQGSSNSHTAILSRTMNLPAVVGIGQEFEQVKDGAVLAVDADEGCVYVDPDAPTLRRLRLRIEQNAHARELLHQYRGRESRTMDGHRIEICANIGGVEDVSAARENGADGIGLFRSEFLYMGREDVPTEDEQFVAYRRVLQAMPDKRVVVRTLDIGADKQAPCLNLPKEENPALGLRAIRISLTRPELFLTQAKALLRASHYGRLAVMFPFVTSEQEVLRLRGLWERAKDELRKKGALFSEQVEIGIMIETPAAAMISDRLAPLVDFFSIGSNDLTQYTLALDRQNAALEEFCDTHHEAILRLIRYTIENARRAGIWVGICGELGADLLLTEEFLRMGVDELSVTPPAILPLRERVCTMRINRQATKGKESSGQKERVNERQGEKWGGT